MLKLENRFSEILIATASILTAFFWYQTHTKVEPAAKMDLGPPYKARISMDPVTIHANVPAPSGELFPELPDCIKVDGTWTTGGVSCAIRFKPKSTITTVTVCDDPGCTFFHSIHTGPAATQAYRSVFDPPL